MARNRQRAKERQAERRAARQSGETVPAPQEGDPLAAEEVSPSVEGRAGEFAASAPPEDLGRSDTVLERGPGTLDELEPAGSGNGADGGDNGGTATPDSPDASSPAGGEEPERGRLISFLRAVVAELRRVQWPDRATLTSLTGVVLGFVLIAGGYLGLLDAIFSRLIQAIL